MSLHLMSTFLLSCSDWFIRKGWEVPGMKTHTHTTQFTFCLDSPCFNVKASESVRAKKTHNIIVGFEGNQGGSKAPRMGRLMVTCPRSAGGAGNVTWTFYLKGLTP